MPIILFATCPKSMHVCTRRSLGAASVRAGSRVWGLPVDKDWRARIRNPFREPNLTHWQTKINKQDVLFSITFLAPDFAALYIKLQ